MSIILKNTAKILLLLVLTSALIACAEKEEEDEGKKTTLGDIARQYKSSKEFQDDPDMNKLKQLVPEGQGTTCFQQKDTPLAIAPIDSTDALKISLGKISMALICDSGIQYLIDMLRINNVVASETISGSGTTTFGEGETASPADFSYSGQINKPNSENVLEFLFVENEVKGVSFHWSGRVVGDTLTVITINNILPSSESVLNIKQESPGKGVYRLLCNVSDASTSCLQYRYSAAAGDFDANAMFGSKDSTSFSAYWGNLKKPQAAFLRMSPTTNLEQATFPTEVALPGFVSNQTAAYQYPVFKKVIEQLRAISADNAENFFQSAAGKEVLKSLYEVLDYQKKATDDKSMDSVYGMTTN